jgi:hypothetical protein
MLVTRAMPLMGTSVVPQQMLARWPFVSFRDVPEILTVTTLDEISFSRIQKVVKPFNVELMTSRTLRTC